MTRLEAAGRLLLRGGAVVTMDREIGTLGRGDVLMADGRIVAVAASLGDADAEVVDTTGMIVAPGLVDTHRHTWQTALRGLCADWTLTDYFNGIRLTASPCYEPDDVRVANHAGALEALDAGVTTILDFSHCMNTPDHADAAIDGLLSSGIRARHCYGFFESAPSVAFADHAARLRDFERVAASGSFGDRLRLGVSLTETGLVPWRHTVAEIETTRAADALIAVHTGCVWGSLVTSGVLDLHAGGLLGPDQVHVHCNTLDDEEWRALASAGAKVSTSPETELSMGMGRLAIASCVDHGIRPTLSCDTVVLNSGDLFTQMRLALAYLRHADNDPVNCSGAMPDRLAWRAADAVSWVTANGADAVGLGDRIGSLTPGKDADVIVIGGPAPAAGPVVDPEANLVFQASVGTVRHVLVAGRWVKRDGVLLDVDSARLRADLDASSERLLERIRARVPTLPPPPLLAPEAIEEWAALNFSER